MKKLTLLFDVHVDMINVKPLELGYPGVTHGKLPSRKQMIDFKKISVSPLSWSNSFASLHPTYFYSHRKTGNFLSPSFPICSLPNEW